MSGIWTVFTGHILDINFLLNLMSGIRTVMSGIWTMMSGIGTVMSGIWTLMSGIQTENWSLFRTSKSDVRNMASFHCPYSEHRIFMSGTWTIETVHILDIINFFCPYSGHHSPYSGHHCPYSGHQFFCTGQ